MPQKTTIKGTPPREGDAHVELFSLTIHDVIGNLFTMYYKCVEGMQFGVHVRVPKPICDKMRM